MRVVLQNQASEDTIQLFDSTQTPVAGLLDTDVVVKYKKSGAVSFTTKAMTPLTFTDRGNGNYAIDFDASDFDTLGLFRYRVEPVVAGTFLAYDDSVEVVDTIPTFPPDPPEINAQDDIPVGLTPNPVPQGQTLTINGSNLANALSVTIGGVAVPITANTDSQIQVTVTKPVAPLFEGVSLGDQAVIVTTVSGVAEAQVTVVLDPSDIPTLGCVSLTGVIFDPKTCKPLQGVGVHGRVLDMPNLNLGVAWTDEIQSVSTDANGRFFLTMPRNMRIEVSIPRTRYRRVFTTPDVATADIFTEIPNPPVIP